MLDPIINSLTQVDVGLFNLSSDSRLTDAQQHQVFVSASQLHGVTVSLANQQFATNTPAYTSAIAGVQTVNQQLNNVNQAITNAVNTVNNLAALAGAIDSLVKLASALLV